LNPAEPVGNWRVMSPTSYQAAAPRVSLIADARSAVKRYRPSENFVSIEHGRKIRPARKITQLAAYQELYGVLVNGDS
jgi:hypothetical protein